VLLQQSNRNVSGIAFSLDFWGVTYFNNFFKKHTNLNPTQYKKTFLELKDYYLFSLYQDNPNHMAKIFITGSTEGIGFLAAQRLLSEGNEVHMHARNRERAADLQLKLGVKATTFIADLSDIRQVLKLSEQLNYQGKYDAIIHNAGVLSVVPEVIFKVNVLAPYLLTTRVEKPNRLIYLSSGMHRGGKVFKNEFYIQKTSYSDSKLFITTLANAFAKQYPDLYINSVDPGWVPTRMGGSGAPDDLQKGYETQAWLATSKEKEALVSGKYFHHRRQEIANPETNSPEFQNRLLSECESIIKEGKYDRH
tara:strand:+ start:235 stop:1155 length:921 start_codon:yes stop_codon:yes gene_type:complete